MVEKVERRDFDPSVSTVTLSRLMNRLIETHSWHGPSLLMRTLQRSGLLEKARHSIEYLQAVRVPLACLLFKIFNPEEGEGARERRDPLHFFYSSPLCLF